ncbi:Choline kinase A2 [Pseudolycoriella hygida]|uniref:Choline kinase A2 n=1 Tax=Pseudolycoriella hygida TaxID=35572 RepID=A0A9Q0NDC0_9DIPT|nr:Choline kinase A2 [Pseudolycoriella hygida]
MKENSIIFITKGKMAKSRYVTNKGINTFSVAFQATSNLDEMRDIAARICRDYLNGAWKTISAEDIQLKRISGGLSNFLYHVSLPDNFDNKNQSLQSGIKRPRKDSVNTNNLPEPKEVLLRIYGQVHGEHALESVLTESVVFTLLSERKLGPKLHGIFPGGRIEQYIPARPLATNELSDPKISCKIAEKMAKIHSLNIPVSKEPEWLWKTIDRWLDNAETILGDFISSNPIEVEQANAMKNVDFRKELEWIKDTVDKASYPVVFSHNDLQEGNILFKEGISDSRNSSMEQLSSYFDDSAALDAQYDDILLSPSSSHSCDNVNNNTLSTSSSRKRSFSGNQDDCDLESTRDSVLSGNSQTYSDICDPDLMIIDFEYCAYNYRGFDLANHFLEWTLDYRCNEYPFFYHKKERYPTVEQQERFITSYLVELASGTQNYRPSITEIEELKEEIKCFTLVSHFLWSLWSIVNVHQEIEFGYLSYGECRIKEYFAAKELYKQTKGLVLKRKHTLDERR